MVTRRHWTYGTCQCKMGKLRGETKAAEVIVCWTSCVIFTGVRADRVEQDIAKGHGQWNWQWKPVWHCFCIVLVIPKNWTKQTKRGLLPFAWYIFFGRSNFRTNRDCFCFNFSCHCTPLDYFRLHLRWHSSCQEILPTPDEGCQKETSLGKT